MIRIFNAEREPLSLKSSPIKEYIWHRSADLAKLVDSKHLQFDIKSLDPEKYSYPYHFHRNAEEILVVLSGKAMLRTPETFVEIGEGDIVFFGIGPSGAHQLYNHTHKPCTYLDLRTDLGMDICEFPDTGKINILPNREVYRVKDQINYYEGEGMVSERWPKHMITNTPDTENEENA